MLVAPLGVGGEIPIYAPALIVIGSTRDAQPCLKPWKREDHHHPLSLSFHVPPPYLKYDYRCDVCNKYLLPKYWIYHCHLCSYAVHLKCAFNTTTTNTANASIEKEDIIRLPTNDVAEELIRSFVMRDGGGSIIAAPSYMSCSECKYNLHMACFDLPPQLIPSIPLHKADHDELLVLESTCHRLRHWDFWNFRCSICGDYTTGLSYKCKKCSFRADIKCASLPDTIYHAAHPQHPLKLLSREEFESDSQYSWRSCAAACRYIYPSNCYVCESCDFMVDARCAALPASMRSGRWDKQHPLLLTYNANLNHPGDFYCDHCETEMNPKSWMYHCRHCDLSFHPRCFPATSGGWRNVKLGGQQQYYVKNHHPHPLTFQRRCDLCRRNMHEWPGFHCAPCNFFICFEFCGKKLVEKDGIQAIELNDENHIIPS